MSSIARLEEAIFLADVESAVGLFEEQSPVAVVSLYTVFRDPGPDDSVVNVPDQDSARRKTEVVIIDIYRHPEGIALSAEIVGAIGDITHHEGIAVTIDSEGGIVPGVAVILRIPTSRFEQIVFVTVDRHLHQSLQGTVGFEETVREVQTAQADSIA